LKLSVVKGNSLKKLKIVAIATIRAIFGHTSPL